MARQTQEGQVAKSGRGRDRINPNIDPHWPADDDLGQHPVSEVAADRQGALSPYGDLAFPLPADEVGYQHPETEINK